MKKTLTTIGITVIVVICLMVAAQHHVHADEMSGLKTKVVGKGKPVLMIPGLTCDGAVWDETIKAMGEGYEFHVFTLPGFAGNAPLENLEAGFFAQVQAMVLDYIDANKIEKPIIIGHSLGGFMALNIAIERPGLPSKLVIVDSLPFLAAIQMPQLKTAKEAKPMVENMKSMMLSNADQPKAMSMAFQKQMLQTMIKDPAKIDIAAEWGVSSDVPTVAQAMYEMYTTDIRNDLDKIKAPTLVLGAWIAYKQYGVTRESNMQNFKAQYQKLSNVTIDMTDKGNHFIMWDDPEFFHDWLKKFL